MSTANYTNPDPITWATGKLLWARVRQPNGTTTAGEAAVPERTTPKAEGVYPLPTIPFTLQDGAAADAEYTIEVREVPTLDSAGFDSTSSVYVASGAFTVDAAGTITDGGQSGAAAGTTEFRLKLGDGNGNLIDDPGLVSVTVKTPGIIAVGSTAPVVAAGTAFTHTATGIWTGPTVTDAASRLTYIAPLTKTFADTHTEDVQQVVTGSVAAATHCGDIATVRRLIGAVNEQADADVDADADANKIAAQEDATGTDADLRVRVQLTALGLAVPDRTTDAGNFELVAFAANRYWAEGLGKLRGLPVDQQGRPVNPYKAYVQEADDAIKNLIGKILRGSNPLPNTFSSAPACFGDEPRIGTPIIDPHDLCWG